MLIHPKQKIFHDWGLNVNVNANSQYVFIVALNC